jgi:hypothetical protein
MSIEDVFKRENFEGENSEKKKNGFVLTNPLPSDSDRHKTCPYVLLPPPSQGEPRLLLHHTIIFVAFPPAKGVAPKGRGSANTNPKQLEFFHQSFSIKLRLF